MTNGLHRFSGENQEIIDLAQWFHINMESMMKYKIETIKRSKENKEVPEEFLFMTMDEVEKTFFNIFREIEYSFCLNLIASIEAKFRMDYIVRATDKLKDPLSRDFREIYKEYQEKVGTRGCNIGGMEKLLS